MFMKKKPFNPDEKVKYISESRIAMFDNGDLIMPSNESFAKTSCEPPVNGENERLTNQPEPSSVGQFYLDLRLEH
jgi:hypothetical protein